MRDLFVQLFNCLSRHRDARRRRRTALLRSAIALDAHVLPKLASCFIPSMKEISRLEFFFDLVVRVVTLLFELFALSLTLGAIVIRIVRIIERVVVVVVVDAAAASAATRDAHSRLDSAAFIAHAHAPPLSHVLAISRVPTSHSSSIAPNVFAHARASLGARVDDVPRVAAHLARASASALTASSTDSPRSPRASIVSRAHFSTASIARRRTSRPRAVVAPEKSPRVRACSAFACASIVVTGLPRAPLATRTTATHAHATIARARPRPPPRRRRRRSPVASIARVGMHACMTRR